jgi:filamentous hemagglutinin
LSGQTLGQAKTTLRTAAEAHKGSTRLGHALSKHAGRKSDVWGNISGSPSTYHSQAMKHLREIYMAPGSFQKVTYPSGVSFLEKMLPDGRGLRLQLDHVFKGFID